MSTLKVNKIIPTAGVATGQGGGIVQVISAFKSDTASQNSNTLAAISGLQPQITPTSNTSKVLININLKIGSSSDFTDMNLKLYRSIGGTETEIFSATDFGSRTSGFWGCQDFVEYSTYFQLPVHSQYLDSPATTSQITYLIKWQVQSQTMYLNRTGDDTNDSGAHRLSSSVTLMEVSA
tara:strand:+ start:181 stop:717 length:537 start_codon:yes stop_codon:yes gene_type:complete